MLQDTRQGLASPLPRQWQVGNVVPTSQDLAALLHPLPRRGTHFALPLRVHLSQVC